MLDLDAVMTFLAIDNYLADSDGFLGDFGINIFYFVRLNGRGSMASFHGTKTTG